MTENRFLAGIPIPVDPGRIERELAGLWKPQDSSADSTAVTRASVSNLIVHLPAAAAREGAREDILALGRRFPSRMIILTTSREGRAAQDPLTASVNAICHVPAPGSPPVCCEQITLDLAGDSLELFPGAVLPLLIPDLPVILILRGPRPEPLVDLFEDVVDRVVLDSRLASPRELDGLHDLLRARPALSADDLAWRDTVGWRRMLRDIYDDAEARPLFKGLKEITVTHASGGPGPAAGSRSALLAGWLASRLGWILVNRAVDGAVDRAVDRAGPNGARLEKDGAELRVSLASRGLPGLEPGAILSVHLASGDPPDGSFLTVTRPGAGEHLRIEYHTRTACVLPRRVPFRKESAADLLGGALERITDQDVLRGAVEIAREL